MPNYSTARTLAKHELSLANKPPRTSVSRGAGCDAHKSGSVRGVPVRAGAPTRPKAWQRPPVTQASPPKAAGEQFAEGEAAGGQGPPLLMIREGR